MFLLIEGIKGVIKDFSVVNAKRVRPLSLILVLLSFYKRYYYMLFFRDTNKAYICPDSWESIKKFPKSLNESRGFSV